MTRSLDAYLEKLPAGLASYPQMTIKGAIFRQFLKGVDTGRLRASLPARLVELVDNPPPPSVWMPEVQSNAVFAVVADVCFADEAAFMQYAYENNKEVLESPLYSLLIRMLSPSRVVKLAAKAWGQMHKGTTLFADGHGAYTLLRLDHPPDAYPRCMLQALSQGYLSAAHLAGEEAATVDLVEVEADGAAFKLNWNA
jgi:hypothetical protein